MRVINLDWLEIFCIEPIGQIHDAAFFRLRGMEVESRAYGTRQYAEMFTIMQNGHPMIEIRRDPLSKKSQGGIFNDHACHIRLPNEMLYTRTPVNTLVAFLKCYGYEFKNITRFDIAMDFPRFDSGLEVQDFVNMYMRGEVAKIHQSKLAMYGQEKNHPDKTEGGWDVGAHGEDAWQVRKWNSLKWGAPTSAVSTKLYNKSIELNRDGHDKPYIRQQWDVVYPNEQEMWRIEFSIKNNKRHLVERDSGQLLEIELATLADRDALQFTFFSFFSEYFDFRHVQTTSNGTAKRKDLCSRLDMFSFDPTAASYKPLTITNKKDSDRVTKMVIKRLKEIIARCDVGDAKLKESCLNVLMFLNYERSRTGITPDYIEQAWQEIYRLESATSIKMTYDH